MITREEYNKALDIVEAYQKQILISDVKDILYWNDLKIGSKVLFTKTMTKYLTEGKEYDVIFVDTDWKETPNSYFEIIADNNKRKFILKHAKGYLMSIV